MEKRDLYDANRNLTGETIFKGESIPDGRYIVVVLVYIQNSKGEFLIQKRSLEKNGKYASTGGHAKSGETGLQGIITEIKEELGLDVTQNELELIFSGREDKEQVFFDLFYLKKDFDIQNLTLQKEEVDFVKWFSVSEINVLIENDLFFSNHAEEFYRTLEILKNRKENFTF